MKKIVFAEREINIIPLKVLYIYIHIYISVAGIYSIFHRCYITLSFYLHYTASTYPNVCIDQDQDGLYTK